MPLKEKTARLRNHLMLEVFRYRMPLPVREVLQFSSGNCYPICPRCDMTIDREYMCFCDRCGQKLSWAQFDHADVIPAPRRKRISG